MAFLAENECPALSLFKKQVFIGAPVYGGTSGSVLFVDNTGMIGQDNTNFFWNNTAKTLLAGKGIIVGTGAAGVDYDFLTVIGQNSTLLGKWYEDESVLQINSNSNNIGIVYGSPSTDLFNILELFVPVGISLAGFSSTNEAGFFLESKGNLGVLNGSLFAGFYNNGSAVQNGQLLCAFIGGGQDTTGALPTGGGMYIYGAGTWSATSTPTEIGIFTNPVGFNNTLNEVARFTSWGRVQIGDQSASNAYDGDYAFFPTPDTKFQVSGQITSIGTSGSPLDILKLANVTSYNFNPSADTNSSIGVTVYGGAGFNAFATGTHNMNGGLDIGGETISVVGAFGQFANKQTSTNTLDGAVGVLFTAAHYGYGGVGNKIFGAIFSGETSDDAGLGSVSGSQSYIAGAKFIVRASGVNLTTGVSSLFVEPYAYDQLTGVGTPTITNKTAIDLRGTLSIKSVDVATAASITNMAVEASIIRLTGSTATALHGLHADAFDKLIWIYNVSSATVTLKHQSGTEGTAANRIICNTGADIAILAGKAACLWYDTNQSRWIVFYP